MAATTGADPQTIMMIIGGIISGLVIGLGTLFYRQSPTARPAVSAQSGHVEEGTVFFQGPFQAILDKQSAMALQLERMAGMHVELREAIGEALRMTRHDLKGVLHEIDQGLEADLNDIKHQLAELGKTIVRIEERTRRS